MLIALAPAALLVLSTAASPPAGAASDDWTKVSTGSGAPNYGSSLHRTPGPVLHVLYPKTNGERTTTYGHAAIDADGSLRGSNDVLVPGWATLDPTPALIGDGAGLRAVFGGVLDTSSGFWSDGRMYTATAPEDGAAWTLPAEAVGRSRSASASHGTAAVELEDGTPVAAFARRSTIVWHVGTGDDPDHRLRINGCCASSLAMVDNGGTVWIGWYANGSTAATNGTFVKQILPTVGPTIKAPGSSVGAHSVPTGGVALAVQARVDDDGGPAVWAAYCGGYPTCDHVGLWKVGDHRSRAKKVPGSRNAAHIALSASVSDDPDLGVQGVRVWVAWSDTVPRVRAVRTGKAGFTPVRTLGLPPHHRAVHDISIEGVPGPGDVVVNTGRSFWHARVEPGLTLEARPPTWQHGTERTVYFSVKDAGNLLGGARVEVGTRTCTTSADRAEVLHFGRCAITFPRTVKPGTLIARATHSGYAAGSVRLEVT